MGVNRCTAADYQGMLMSMLPPGLAFNARPDSNLGRLLLADANGFLKIENESYRLIKETNPLTTFDALTEWEEVCGLPDNCSRATQSVDERRKSLLLKLNRPAGQSKRFMVEQAAHMGYKIEIEEFYPAFVNQARIGARIYHCPSGQVSDGQVPDYYHGWYFVWMVKAPATHLKHARAGASVVGDRLREWGNVEIECRLNKIKPAHTYILFSYGNIMQRDGEEILWQAIDCGHAPAKHQYIITQNGLIKK